MTRQGNSVAFILLLLCLLSLFGQTIAGCQSGGSSSGHDCSGHSDESSCTGDSNCSWDSGSSGGSSSDSSGTTIVIVILLLVAIGVLYFLKKKQLGPFKPKGPGKSKTSTELQTRSFDMFNGAVADEFPELSNTPGFGSALQAFHDTMFETIQSGKLPKPADREKALNKFAARMAEKFKQYAVDEIKSAIKDKAKQAAQEYLEESGLKEEILEFVFEHVFQFLLDFVGEELVTGFMTVLAAGTPIGQILLVAKASVLVLKMARHILGKSAA
jgi:hypothetical protein